MKITLCGSVAKAGDLWHTWNGKLTLAGNIVYSVSMLVPDAETNLPEGQKEILDLVHLAKIEESDAVFVLDIDHYIGSSTSKEIKWATIRGKKIFYLSSLRATDYERLGIVQ